MEFIRFEEMPASSGKLGVITLNRTQALNALTREMILALYQQLQNWAVQPDISAVIIKSDSEKAFCAGGDIRALYMAREQFEQQRQFFYDEYRLDYLIGTYPKPYIALMNGIVMGGGAGISVHARYRVACENLIFAMPETAIGLFPDVGASHFLNRAPGYLGRYLALSGARINIADAVYANFVDYYISSNHYSEVIRTLANTAFDADTAEEKISTVLQEFAIVPDVSIFKSQQDFMDGIFCGEQVSTIMDYLSHDDGEWSQAVLSHLNQRSPMSMTITLEALKRAGNKDLAYCVNQDFYMVQTVLCGHDLYEGIRATVIDKDMQPAWSPASLNEITDDQIKKYFSHENKMMLELE
jgi:enoyl-CoA hydratase/carnithine racemase